MKIYEVGEIVSAMKQAYPSDRCDYDNLARKYIKICVHELCQAYGRPESNRLVLGVYTNCVTKKIKNKIKTPDGKEVYWYKWLLKNYPFWTVVEPGHNLGTGTPSLVKPLFSLKELIRMRYRFSIINEVHIDTDKQIHTTEIDLKSLGNYLQNTAELLITGEHDMPEHKLAYRVSYAKSIEDIATEYHSYLPQAVSNTKSHRTYYEGINLINAPVTVREAALGKCVKQDLTACMFAFKLGFVESYFREQHIDIRDRRLFTTFRQLVQEKTITRKQLAQTLTNTKATEEFKLKLVKQAISAIGFGAKINNPLGALQDIIYQPDDREAFIQHYITQGLIQDQRDFSRICREVISKDFVKTNLPHALKGGIYNQNRAEVYLYQWFEKTVMDYIVEHELTRCAEPLLVVHDCIYTRKQIDPAINVDLQQHFGNGHLTLETQQIDAYKRKPQETETERAHRLHIEAENIKASNYVGQIGFVESDGGATATPISWQDWKKTQ